MEKILCIDVADQSYLICLNFGLRYGWMVWQGNDVIVLSLLTFDENIFDRDL